MQDAKSIESGSRMHELLCDGRVNEAVQFAKLLDPSDADADAFYSAGSASLRLGRVSDAACLFQIACQRAPDNGQYWAAQGEAWYDLRVLMQAEYAWSRAAALGQLSSRQGWLRTIANMVRNGGGVSKDTILTRLRAVNHKTDFPDPAAALPNDPLRLPVIFSLGSQRAMEVSLQINVAPDPETTPTILQLLREARIHASFFVVGQAAAKHPHLIGQMVAAGHEVYAIPYTRRVLVGMDAATVALEMERTEAVLRQFRPTPSPYPVRLPGGQGWDDAGVHAALRSWNPNTVIAHWSVDARDYLAARRFTFDEEVMLWAKLHVAEAVLDPNFSGACLPTHDDEAGLVRKPVSFLRAFYGMLFSTIQDLGIAFGRLMPEISSPIASPVSPGLPTVLRIDADNIATLRERYGSAGLPIDDHAEILRMPWINHAFPYGYGVLNDDRFVGGVQTIYADRRLDGRRETVCNIAGWWIDEPFRGTAIQMVAATLNDCKDIALTSFTTPTDATDIWRSFGWTVLDQTYYAVPMQLNQHPLARDDFERFFLALSDDSKQVANDHRGCDIQHCLVEGPIGRCFFVYRTDSMLGVQVAVLLYLDGNIDQLLATWSPPSGSPLAACSDLLIEHRFLGERVLEPSRLRRVSPRYASHPEPLARPLDFMYCAVPFRAELNKYSMTG